MKKFIAVFILAIFSIVGNACPKTYNFGKLDSHLATFINTPNSLIDTTIMINGKSVVVYGEYSFNPFFIGLDITSNSRKVLKHCAEVLKRSWGFSEMYDIVYDYDTIHLNVQNPNRLKGCVWISYEREKTRILKEEAERIKKERELKLQRLVEEQEKEYAKQIAVKQVLDSLKQMFYKLYDAEFTGIVNRKNANIAKLEKYIDRCEEQRFNELDALESAYAGRLNGEVFPIKKRELNEKYAERIVRAKKQISEEEEYVEDWISSKDVEYQTFLRSNGFAIIYNKNHNGLYARIVNREKKIDVEIPISNTIRYNPILPSI